MTDLLPDGNAATTPDSSRPGPQQASEARAEQIARWAFIGSAALVIFSVGAFIGGHHMFPYSLYERARREFAALQEQEKPHNLTPAWHKFAGARLHDAAAVSPGVTLLTSSWLGPDGWKPEIRLIDFSGNILHRWRTDPAQIWPTSPYSDSFSQSKNKSDNYVHGSYLFDNGDIIFNIEYLTVARMNARGDILWKLPIRAHHSIERDADGNFWICSMDWKLDTPAGRKDLAKFPGLKAPAVEDFAVKISGDGKILKQVSITRALFQSKHQDLLWRAGGRVTDDFMHSNDVEPLLPSVAPQYPMFEAGDLLISLRTLNTILVIDPDTEQVKWLDSSFVKQHDADFIGDGWIQVFNNRNDLTDTGKFLGPTRLMAIKPSDHAIRVVYPLDLRQAFYTQWGGKAQRLPNGNQVITEARRGRVFEVTAAGTTVWEWVHDRTQDGMVPEVLEGTRYPLTPQQIAAWKSN